MRSSHFLLLALGACALITGCGSNTDDGSDSEQEEAPPAATSEALGAGCHWERLPGPCPTYILPGQQCFPTYYGYGHWQLTCPAQPSGGSCPAGTVWTGVSCVPGG
jgi:hypothetical protein